MDEQARLYALALALVPDVDVAGDIFMDARDQADLLRRAARWRRQQGLPALAPPARLPDLSAEEREYALHLATRGRRRRRLRPLSGFSAALVICLMVILVGFRGQVLADRGLAADPAYRAQPVGTAEKGALTFAVYKVSATPGAVTFWWAMQGRDAAKAASALRLNLDYSRLATLATLVSHETAVVREDRLVGRTTFRTPLPVTTSAGLSASRGGSEPEWRVALLIAPEPDPTARTIAVDRSFEALWGQVRVTVVSITVAGDYTVVRYRLEGEDYQVALAQQLEVVADDKPVMRYGTLRRFEETGEREVLFGPVAAGAARLELRFPRLTDRSQDQGTVTVDLKS